MQAGLDSGFKLTLGLICCVDPVFFRIDSSPFVSCIPISYSLRFDPLQLFMVHELFSFVSASESVETTSTTELSESKTSRHCVRLCGSF